MVLTKRCGACGRTLPASAFALARSRYDGLQSACKECKQARDARYFQQNRDAILAARRTPEGRDRRLASIYGLTVEEMHALRMKYDGLCWICREAPVQVVDHDHVTGAVRGALCSNCNKALGFFRDNAALMRRAIKYLAR